MPRTIVFYTEPSIADPCQTIKAVDITDRNNPITFIDDLSPIEKIISDMKRKVAEDCGYQRGVDDVLATLGMSIDEYITKQREQMVGGNNV